MHIDELIQKRQTIRNFTDEVISQDDLNAILEAGRQAAFAGLAQAGVSNFRHFFVIKRGTPICEKIMDLVSAARLADYQKMQEENWSEKYPAFANAVTNMHGKKPMDLFMAPILVIVAERAGMPAREHVALGYALSNMWLKATDLGIGLKICSGIADIKDTASLKALLRLPAEEEFAFDGCNLGYAAGELYRQGTRPVPEVSVTYL